MKNKTLLRTNIIVCLVILLGFTLTSVISYRSNFGMYKKDIESVSTLSSEGIYSEIATIFSQPINVSLTMANDNLLKNFLSGEKENLTNTSYTKEMQDYLSA
ncbi:MAG: hypothetical protein RR053_03680 [Evtepia sp.]